MLYKDFTISLTGADKQITRKQLAAFILEAANAGCSVPMVINGGGFGYIEPDEAELFVMSYLEPGGEWFREYDEPRFITEEFGDFRDCLDYGEYKDMQFVVLPHLTQYNQENQDIQLGYWD